MMSCLQRERNLKIHFLFAFLSCLLAWYVQLSKQEWLLLILTIAGVIVSEMVNTAIEVMVDLISPEYHPLAKQAKDIAAGAVLFMALVSLIVGYILFVEKF
ncbi:diacylglycerol kinase family protein [Propionispora sp. 2/2-37]|uniref:diacylglycerol kinase family protein n=1 Tax=Propionispora sp. 2/2-37 TaxID=1677858 RepID=UPI00210167B6|nr:diacylglycerol kinase family protein [Propionispora sp. 2/2-37]